MSDNPRGAGKCAVVDAFSRKRETAMNETTLISTVPDTSVNRPSARPEFGFRRIMVPTDFSPRSENAVNYAMELAQRLGARLTLLHVSPEPSAVDYTMAGVPIWDWEEAREQAGKKLAEEVARIKPVHPEVESLLRTGLFCREEILKAAEELPADLLVLTTHGYTGWKHLLFGSDAEKILERASCPILIAR
jgi:universal stress protein A